MLSLKRLGTGLLVLGLGLTFGSHVQNVHAAGFQIRPLLPSDNRVSEQQGYYDVSLAQTKSRTLGIKIYNPATAAVKVQVQMRNATTSDGKIIYGKQYDSANRMTSLLSGPVSITVPGKQEREYDFYLNRGTHSWSGERLGAIALTEVPAKNGAVRNRVRYTIAVIARDHKLPVRKMRRQALVAVTGGNSKAGAQIRVQLRNRDNALLESTKTTLLLRNAFFRYLDYKASRGIVKVSPRASYQLDFNLAGQKLANGEYRLQLESKNNYYKQTNTAYVRVHNGTIYPSSQAAYKQYLLRRVAVLVAILIIIVIAIRGFYRWRKNRKEV
jgi:hypothetical protein